jgi:hypothetical protein
MTELCYASTINCHTDRMSWFIRGIIDMKVIIMSVAIKYRCYGVLKPENDYTQLRNPSNFVLCMIGDLPC